jgi:hypothetical protein
VSDSSFDCELGRSLIETSGNAKRACELPKTYTFWSVSWYRCGFGENKHWLDEAISAGTINLSGGARRNRTDDLFNAIEALSQLSYGPVFQNLVIAASIGAKPASFSGAGV